MNQKEGRSQREAARDAYLMSLGKARLHEEEDVRLIAKFVTNDYSVTIAII